ncbi:nucleotidyl transferase AbiEii/AbiGii toxin family protein [Paracidovorax citrulli]
MTDADLPNGTWKTLFPRALQLVGEIEKHGGRRPFFTFGGGTVLMLRHNHRFSKDIDIFVPDPQSLGYVNPRLSDLAEDLCNSQYAEDATFVKLYMPEGEIDFVASPNLLGRADAFEEWQLFGHTVCVETSAEIVAKKMYHRGHCATPRDLFDFALVAEREPGALRTCNQFLMGNLDAFREAVRQPLPSFVQQFEAIIALDYRPSFEEASETALSYLDALAASRDNSRVNALRQAEESRLVVRPLDADKGDYCGPLVHWSDRHVVQSLGRGEAVIHESFRLPTALSQMKGSETPVRLQYRYGNVSLITRDRENGRGR